MFDIDKFLGVLKNTGETDYAIEKGAGIKQGQIYQWRKRNVRPSLEHAYNIAEYLNMPLDDLVGRTVPEGAAPPQSHTLTETQKTKITELAQSILNVALES